MNESEEWVTGCSHSGQYKERKEMGNIYVSPAVCQAQRRNRGPKQTKVINVQQDMEAGQGFW